MAMNNTFLRIVGLGALSGLRSMAGPVVLAHRLHRRPPQQWPHPALQHLTKEPFLTIARLAAGGEMLVDKLPFIPARTDPMPLTGRAMAGAVVGGVLSAVEEQPWWQGALLGGASAVAAAFAGYHARRLLTADNRLPDALVATLEDGIVMGVGQRLLG